MQGGETEARVTRHGGRGGFMLKVLAGVWACGLGLHLALRLPDVRLWIGFPLLVLPWWLIDRGWFEP